MRLLSCRTIANLDYIVDNVSYDCDTINLTSIYVRYSLSVSIPILLIIVLIIPGVMFIGLKEFGDTGRLNTLLCKYTFGFLYVEYKHSKYLWEFMKMGEKVLLIVILQYYE